MLKISVLFALGALLVSSLSARAQNLPKLVPLDSKGLLTYYIAEGIPSFGSESGDIELAAWAFKEWERSARGTIRLARIADEGTARIRLYWRPSGTGKYGQAQTHIANRQRVALVFILPSIARQKILGPAASRDPLLRDTVLYLSCLHEIGHALGLGHSAAPDDVMHTTASTANFQRYRRTIASREDIAGASWLSPNDQSQLRALYAR